MESHRSSKSGPRKEPFLDKTRWHSEPKMIEDPEEPRQTPTAKLGT